MTIQALGYLGIGTDEARRLDELRHRPARHAGGGSWRRRARFPHGRPQAAPVYRSLPARGAHYFGWEVADAAALDTLAARLDAPASRCGANRAALADQRCVARPDLLRRSVPATGSRPSTARRSPTLRSAPAARSPVSAPGRSAWAMPADGHRHRRRAGVLPRPARLPHQRLHPRAAERVFPARQRAPSQRGAVRRRRTPACTT